MQEMFEMFVNANPSRETFRRDEFLSFVEENGGSKYSASSFLSGVPKVERGVYRMSMTAAAADSTVVPITPVQPRDHLQVASASSSEVYVPSKRSTFVPWGYFGDVRSIIESRMFYPVYISGLSGNGKTIMVEQACAALGREFVRVQITPETDEDDLIGGFRLVDGETVFAKGPVIKAMESGAILLIDEVDRGSSKLMSLQGVLEGNPVLIKKTGEVIIPQPGFNVIATANTKGQGDETGRFIAATIIDDAFLERFVISLEQPYPNQATEEKIVSKHMKSYGIDADLTKAFTKQLVTWAQAIRKTYDDGGIDEVIATRRLCHIAQTFAIFGDRMKAIELCVSRFEADTKAAMLDLYSKMDATVGSDNDATDGTYDYENDDRPF